MARNVEIKARVKDLDRMQQLVVQATDRGPEFWEQRDTFFKVDTGRLKLREISDTEAELIYYGRPDMRGPKMSQYERAPVENCRAMRNLLHKELGIIGCVRKKRVVYWVGRTRIHLDEVDGLGNFLELEVVLKEHEPFESGVSEANQLMERLEIDAAYLIPDAYIDLLLRDHEATQT